MRFVPTFWLIMQFLALCLACPALQAAESAPQTVCLARSAYNPPIEPAQNLPACSNPPKQTAQPRFNRLMYRAGLLIFLLVAPLSLSNYVSFLQIYSIRLARRFRQPMPIMGLVGFLLLGLFLLGIFYSIRLLDDSVLISGADKEVGWTRAKTRALLALFMLGILLALGLWALIAGVGILTVYLNLLSFGLLLWVNILDIQRHYPASEKL